MKTRHLNLKTRAPYRLYDLRAKAEEMNSQPNRANADKVNWRDVRTSTFKTQTGAWSRGFNSHTGQRVPVITAFEDLKSGALGLRIVAADELARLDHSGWYQDQCCDRGVIRGVVARLPHGRMLAGYENTDNGEIVIHLDTIYDDADTAARAGDRIAELLAEAERDYDTRYTEARELADRIEEIKGRLAELQVLIASRQFGDGLESEAARLTDEAATITDRLNDEFSDIEV